MVAPNSQTKAGTGEGGSNSGGGLSRAAKKRAKKRKQKQNRQDEQEKKKQSITVSAAAETEEEDDDNENDAKKIHPVPDETAANNNTVESKKKKNANDESVEKPAKRRKVEKVQGEGEEDDEEEKGEDEDELMLILSKAATQLRQILLPEDDNKIAQKKKEGNNNNNNADDEKDRLVAETLSEISAKDRGAAALQFLFAPNNLKLSDFYEQYWEKKPVLVQQDKEQRNKGGGGNMEDYEARRKRQELQHKHRLDGFMSISGIRKMIQQHDMYYGRDLNVTRYQTDSSDGVKRRVTMDKVKESAAGAVESSIDAMNVEDFFVKANPDTLWKQFKQEGCTLRFLCPHRYSASLHSLMSLLELEWGCMVGCNAYLTPAGNSQGFAPHYDDIEAFVMQLQGRKRWKVYEPFSPEEVLPRTSSHDYTENDFRDVKPVMDVVLGPGDVLYMPRGWIHQACTILGDDEASLHLTISSMQQWAWADFLEVLLPSALESATMSDKRLRQGLPRAFLDYMGGMHDNREENYPDLLKEKEDMPASDDSSDSDDGERNGHNTPTDDHETLEDSKIQQLLQEDFRSEAKKCIMKVAAKASDMIDQACDELGKRFLSDRLPLALTATEKVETGQQHQKKLEVTPNSLVRLVRPGVARLVIEDDNKAVVYHCADNSCVYHEHALSPIEFEMDDAAAIEQLLTTLEPHWIAVRDLFHDSVEDKVGVTQALFDEGIIALRDEEAKRVNFKLP